MIDIELIRTAGAETERKLARRGVSPRAVRRLRRLDEDWRMAVKRVETGRARQREASRELGEAQGQQRQQKITALRKLARELRAEEEKLVKITAARQQAWQRLPNIAASDVPEGKGEAANMILREWGKKPVFNFTPQEHWVLGQQLGVIDTARAARVAGARFCYLLGPLVQLQFGLIQMALAVLTSEKILAGIAERAGLSGPTKAWQPIVPPVFVKPQVLEKMARLEPREERYYIASDDLYLIGSAEHTLGALHMDEILAEQSLPLRYVGYSTSFRREAGSYGRDSKGIIRVHQFDKLEIESFSVAEDSLNEHNLIVAVQEFLMQQLGIHYRVVAIAAGDMGDPDARQIDIEAWLPGQNKYRETHTADLMTDYQARRLQTRVRRKSGVVELVHMNDATVFAIGRTLIAIMENYQQADGTVLVPEALQKFVSCKAIKKPA